MKKENPRTADIPQKHMPAIAHLSFSGHSSFILKKIIYAVSKGNKLFIYKDQ
jgi:hypothetical protein